MIHLIGLCLVHIQIFVRRARTLGVSATSSHTGTAQVVLNRVANLVLVSPAMLVKLILSSVHWVGKLT